MISEIDYAPFFSLGSLENGATTDLTIKIKPIYRQSMDYFYLYIPFVSRDFVDIVSATDYFALEDPTKAIASEYLWGVYDADSDNSNETWVDVSGLLKS